MDISDRDLANRCFIETFQGILYRDHSHGLTTKTLMKRNLHRISCTGPSTDILAKGSCTAAYKGDPVKQILHAIFYGDLHNGNLQNLSLSLSGVTVCSRPMSAQKKPNNTAMQAKCSQSWKALALQNLCTLVSLHHVRCNTVRGLLPGHFCPDNSKNVSNSW